MCARVSFLVNFIKKETLTQVFSCKFCEISKNTFFHRTPLVAASVLPKYFKNLKDYKRGNRGKKLLTLNFFAFSMFFLFFSLSKLKKTSTRLSKINLLHAPFLKKTALIFVRKVMKTAKHNLILVPSIKEISYLMLVKIISVNNFILAERQFNEQ